MRRSYYLARGVNTGTVHAVASTTVDFDGDIAGRKGDTVLFEALGPAYGHIMSGREDREGMHWHASDRTEFETLREFGVPELSIGLDFYDKWVGKYPNSHKVRHTYATVHLRRPPDASAD